MTSRWNRFYVERTEGQGLDSRVSHGPAEIRDANMSAPRFDVHVKRTLDAAEPASRETSA